MYAASLNKPIIPCMVGTMDLPQSQNDSDDEADNRMQEQIWSPSDWLGLVVSDLPQVSFEDVDDNNFQWKCEELMHKIQNIVGNQPPK